MVRLLFVGDVMLGRLVNEKLKAASPCHPWGKTLPLFKSADARICNLECVIADGGTPWQPKAFNFRSDAKNVQVLKTAGINCVSLANNHTLDYHDSALLEMLAILNREGVKHTGAGRNIHEARQPAAFRVGGLRIGFVSFTDNEPRWEATPHRPGIFYVPIDRRDTRACKLLKLVTRVKSRVDVVVVAAHWGPNWGYRPPPEHRPFAHALVEAGANIVFGHSCHVFRGIEFYRGAAILYSCGDFVDDYRVNEAERNDRSFVFLVEMENRRIARLNLYPTMITPSLQAQPALDTAGIAQKMRVLCAELGTTAVWRAPYLDLMPPA